MSKLFDTTPFAYVGNNKHYKDLSAEEIDELKKCEKINEIKKEALPAADEVKESSASTIGQMIPQVGLEGTTEEPSTENIISDADSELLKESLIDVNDGADLYFEASNFIETLKNKFKKDDAVKHGSVMKTAKVYNKLKFAKSRLKIKEMQNPNSKDSPEYRELQKKAIESEKEYRKLKKDLNEKEIESLNQYIKGFDDHFNKKIDKILKDIKDYNKKSEAIAIESSNEDYEAINSQIKALQSRIDRIERIQSEWESKHGESNPSLYKQHDELCDKMSELLRKRKELSNTVVESANEEIFTEKNLDSGIAPLIKKLNQKGYETVASSSGNRIIAKNDDNKNGVRNGHFYDDARLVFKGKYDLGKAPKYWYWKKVDNDDEVTYLDIIQIAYDGHPDGVEVARKEWKDNYMKSLSDWVDSLPEVKEETVEESTIDIDNEIDALFESVFGDVNFDISDI